MKYHITDPFYLTREWRHLRKEVLSADKYECQYCKAKGKYTRATHVHHVKPIDRFPELRLCSYYIDERGIRRRQLVSCCRLCHEIEGHPERLKHTKEPLNQERW